MKTFKSKKVKKYFKNKHGGSMSGIIKYIVDLLNHMCQYLFKRNCYNTTAIAESIVNTEIGEEFIRSAESGDMVNAFNAINPYIANQEVESPQNDHQDYRVDTPPNDHQDYRVESPQNDHRERAAKTIKKYYKRYSPKMEEVSLDNEPMFEKLKKINTYWLKATTKEYCFWTGKRWKILGVIKKITVNHFNNACVIKFDLKNDRIKQYIFSDNADDLPILSLCDHREATPLTPELFLW